MLMTKFTYTVTDNGNGVTIDVTRTADNAVKTFTMANSNSLNRVCNFMDSLTDDLTEGYFPTPRKNNGKKD